MRRVFDRFGRWLDAPQPVARLEIVRAFAPLAILGFMSSRLVCADEWLGTSGFRVPHLQGSWRQPLYVPALPGDAPWLVVAVMIAAGLALSAGWQTRRSAILFASTLAFVSLSDRLAAFTVAKIGPVIVLAAACGPAGSQWSVDSWLRRRRGEAEPPALMPLAPVRFLQLMLVVFYCASGLAKAGGDWVTHPYVLWSDLHDSYQTALSRAIGNTMPAWVWPPLQYAVLAFETFAALWFGLARTRPVALLFGLGMHVMIGLMFGTVLWFSLLMMTLLCAAFAPVRLITRAPSHPSSDVKCAFCDG